MASCHRQEPMVLAKNTIACGQPWRAKRLKQRNNPWNMHIRLRPRLYPAWDNCPGQAQCHLPGYCLYKGQCPARSRCPDKKAKLPSKSGLEDVFKKHFLGCDLSGYFHQPLIDDTKQPRCHYNGRKQSSTAGNCRMSWQAPREDKILTHSDATAFEKENVIKRDNGPYDPAMSKGSGGRFITELNRFMGHAFRMIMEDWADDRMNLDKRPDTEHNHPGKAAECSSTNAKDLTSDLDESCDPQIEITSHIERQVSDRNHGTCDMDCHVQPEVHVEEGVTKGGDATSSGWHSETCTGDMGMDMETPVETEPEIVEKEPQLTKEEPRLAKVEPRSVEEPRLAEEERRPVEEPKLAMGEPELMNEKPRIVGEPQPVDEEPCKMAEEPRLAVRKPQQEEEEPQMTTDGADRVMDHKDDSATFQVTLDLMFYKPEDIQVKLDQNILHIYASSDVMVNSETTHHSLDRTINLTPDVNVDTLRCQLMDTGHVVISADYITGNKLDEVLTIERAASSHI